MAELTAKQRRFVEEFCSNGFNGTKAALSAGYSERTAGSISSENLQKPEIQAGISEFMNKATSKALVTTEDIVKELWELGRHAETESVRHSALKTLTDFTGGFDANKKQIEHSGNIPLTIILDEDED